MKREQRQLVAVAVAVGGFALAITTFFGFAELVREHDGWLAAALVALILWREFEFTGMRMDLNRLRAGADRPSNSN